MPTTNVHGQPGSRIKKAGALFRWTLGGLGVATLGGALVCALNYEVDWIILAGAGGAFLGGAYITKRPRLTTHEKEVHAWEAEFPGLPWYMDDVKDSRQLDQWERARDYWEKKH